MDACMHASQAHILSISGHLVVCARTMCKQCFTESKRLVKVDNGQCHLQREDGRAAMFLFGVGNARNGPDFVRETSDQRHECHSPK
jgi:hypothetical protein